MGVIGNGKTTNDTLPLLQGTATAGATVNIYINGTLLPITVTADAVSGAWSYQLPDPLTNGVTYNFTVAQTVNGILSGQSPNYAITIDTTAPQAPTITSIIDDVAPELDRWIKGKLQMIHVRRSTELANPGQPLPSTITVSLMPQRP